MGKMTEGECGAWFHWAKSKFAPWRSFQSRHSNISTIHDFNHIWLIKYYFSWISYFTSRKYTIERHSPQFHIDRYQMKTSTSTRTFLEGEVAIVVGMWWWVLVLLVLLPGSSRFILQLRHLHDNDCIYWSRFSGAAALEFNFKHSSTLEFFARWKTIS